MHFAPSPASGDIASKDWTFFVYMNADNNLEPDAIYNINQMEQVGSTSSVNIVVQIRRSPKYDFSNGNWIGTRRLYITKDDDPLTISSQPLPWPCAPLGCQPTLETDDDLGDVSVYKQSIDWLVATYPAKRYAIVFWGHGRGWRTQPRPELFRGLEPGERSGKRITTRQLGDALVYTAEKIGHPVDLVIFDSCNMQMMEVAAELKRSAEIMVGSEDIVPPDGIPYDVILRGLTDDSNIAAVDFGRDIVAAYQRHYTTISSTLSLLRLAELPELLNRLDTLGRLLLKNDQRHEHLRSAYNDSVKFHFADFVDMGLFVALLQRADPTAYEKATIDLRTALDRLVQVSKTTGPELQSATGLSMYFPQPHMFDRDYASLEIVAGAPSWLKVLNDYSDPKNRDIVAELRRNALSTPEMLKVSPERLEFETRVLVNQLKALKASRPSDAELNERLTRLRSDFAIRQSVSKELRDALQ